MEKNFYFNAKSSLPELSLFLDIDPKTERVKKIFWEGKEAKIYNDEMEELSFLAMGQTILEVKNIKRNALKKETRLLNGEKKIANKGLWLLTSAMGSYTGEGAYLKTEKDFICLCFAVTKKDIVKKVSSNRDFDSNTLLQETMAGSACGSCQNMIQNIIEKTRNEQGIIKGLKHSKSRFDEKGHWLKILGMYPGPLLIKLQELKVNWMAREEITNRFQIEFLEIEGFHLSIKINENDKKKGDELARGMSDYFKAELGVLFFVSWIADTPF